MSQETLNVPAAPLTGRGMDDTLPISPLPTWFNTRGVVEDLSVLRRLEGKLLIEKFDVPVIGLHAILKDGTTTILFVQTSENILLITP